MRSFDGMIEGVEDTWRNIIQLCLDDYNVNKYHEAMKRYVKLLKKKDEYCRQ